MNFNKFMKLFYSDKDRPVILNINSSVHGFYFKIMVSMDAVKYFTNQEFLENDVHIHATVILRGSEDEDTQFDLLLNGSGTQLPMFYSVVYVSELSDKILTMLDNEKMTPLNDVLPIKFTNNTLSNFMVIYNSSDDKQIADLKSMLEQSKVKGRSDNSILNQSEMLLFVKMVLVETNTSVYFQINPELSRYFSFNRELFVWGEKHDCVMFCSIKNANILEIKNHKDMYPWLNTDNVYFSRFDDLPEQCRYIALKTHIAKSRVELVSPNNINGMVSVDFPSYYDNDMELIKNSINETLGFTNHKVKTITRNNDSDTVSINGSNVKLTMTADITTLSDINVAIEYLEKLKKSF